jgi:hypothetical protein
MDEAAELALCPRCGKRESTLRDVGRGKFRFYVICGACQWMTSISRTEGIAAKLWNEAKPTGSWRRGGKRTAS